MIIKSMARKEGSSFADIIDYFLRDAACDQNHSLHHNLLGRTRDEVIAEFEENARLLKKRKNGNVAYHEVVSIRCVPGMNKEEQKRKLIEIVSQYARLRAPNCIVLGALHDDHDEHIHVHLLISANELAQTKRYSLTKAQFRKITIDMERRVLADYPELQQKVAIEKEAKVKRSQKAAAMKARAGALPKQDALAADLVQVFQSVGSIGELHEQMQLRELAFYQRGKIVGVINAKTGKRHRLPTLGIDGDYEAMKTRLLGQAQPQQARVRNDETKNDSAAHGMSRASTTEKENNMDLASLLQGVGALADALSIGVTPQAGDETKNTQQAPPPAKTKVKTRERPKKQMPEKVTTASRKTDQEIIAEARRAEIAKLRAERETTNKTSMTRRR